MADVFTKEKRSWVMSRIRSKNTKVENTLAEELNKNKIKYVRYPKIFGNPDFLLKNNIVIFIDSCFWHKCPKHYKLPKSRKDYWRFKANKNAKRDREVSKKLKQMGYKVVRLWGHDVLKNSNNGMKKIKKVLKDF